MIEAVIFDFDGVLVDSLGTFNRLFATIINKELGLGITENDFARYPGMRFEHRIEILCSLHGKSISAKERDIITDMGRQAYYKTHSTKVKLYPGCMNLLIMLQSNGYKIALGSNGDRSLIEKMLRDLKIKEYFDAVVTYNDVARGKPDPEMFLKAAQMLGVPNESCIVVEDSTEGISAAKSAGMKAIGVLTTHDLAKMKDADLIVKTLKDLNAKKILDL